MILEKNSITVLVYPSTEDSSVILYGWQFCPTCQENAVTKNQQHKCLISQIHYRAYNFNLQIISYL